LIKVLLIAQKFPPYNKVGARRWAKFVKYLQYKNLDITVITQDWGKGGEEIHFEKNVKVNRIKDLFFDLKTRFPVLSALITKAEFINRRLFKHTDEGYLFNKKAIELGSKLIKKENITIVIATSPPWSTPYFASLLLKKHPDIKIIQDFRDAWIDDYFACNPGTPETHPTFLREVEMEKYALNNCHALVTVTPGLLDRLKVKINNSTIVKKLITNGYDEQDYVDPKTLPYPKDFNPSKINICHFGTLDFGREEEFIRMHSKLSLEFGNNDSLQFILVGNNNQKLNKYIEERKLSSVKLLPHQTGNTLKAFMAHADFHLIVNDTAFYYAYGSKIFDAFLYRRPVIFISKPNGLSDFIATNKIGWCSDTSDNSLQILAKKVLELSGNKETIGTYFKYDEANLEVFSIKHLAGQYYNLIVQLASK
jgi:hypothetical protein